MHITLCNTHLKRSVLLIRIRDPVPFGLLDPGPESGIGFFPDPGSRILDPWSQTHIFESLVSIFCDKSSIILWKLAQIIFSGISKIKWFSILWNLWLQKKVWQPIFFRPSLLLLFLDPGSKIRDPGWVKIRIRDKYPRSATLKKRDSTRSYNFTLWVLKGQ